MLNRIRFVLRKLNARTACEKQRKVAANAFHVRSLLNVLYAALELIIAEDALSQCCKL